MRPSGSYPAGFVILALCSAPAFAQAPAAPPPPPLTAPTPLPAAPVPEAYSPRPSTSAVPMRVEVLSATSFLDVETKQVYRLYGIDACDVRQTATLGKQTWPCGIVAMAWLVTATLNKWVACTVIRQHEGANIGRCATGDQPDLAAEMLKVGYAMTLPGAEDRLIPTYPQIEKDARVAYRGLWASSFQMPWTYRQQHPKAP